MSWVVNKVLPIFNGNMRRRLHNYQSFIDSERFSAQYKSMDELYKTYPKYDIYMVGSDQVWNPSASSSIEPYFLTFARKMLLK